MFAYIHTIFVFACTIFLCINTLLFFILTSQYKMDVVHVSPSKKNPRGKVSVCILFFYCKFLIINCIFFFLQLIGTGQKRIIINVYKDKVNQHLENLEMRQLSYREIIVAVSKTTGIGQRTVQITLAEYKKEGTVSQPNKKRVKPTIIQKVDKFDKNSIRQKIHDFWRRREVPTVKKMLIAINEDEKLPDLKRSSF